QMPILPPPMMAQLAELERRRIVLLAQGAGAPLAPAIACTEKDSEFTISKQQNKCLNVLQRWSLYKAHVRAVGDLESDRGARLKPATDWADYVSQEELEKMDGGRIYRYRIETYQKFYSGGGQSERYKREREAKEEANKPSPPKEQPSDDTFSFLAGMSKDDL